MLGEISAAGKYSKKMPAVLTPSTPASRQGNSTHAGSSTLHQSASPALGLKMKAQQELAQITSHIEAQKKVAEAKALMQTEMQALLEQLHSSQDENAMLREQLASEQDAKALIESLLSKALANAKREQDDK